MPPRPRRGRAARRFSVIYTAEVHGAVEPCGCTSDPLGDISRLATVVQAARRETGAVLLVDAGGLLYSEGGTSARERAADELRAAFLASEFEKLGLAGAALAETDLGGGAAGVQPKRLASNVSGAPAVREPLIQSVGGVKVGLLGVADPALGERLGVKAEPPVAAARRDADKLRRQGAEVLILLAAVDKAVARRVAREAAVDLVVIGRQVGHGMTRAETVARGGGGEGAAPVPARAFLFAPADEMQRVGRIDVVLRDHDAGLQDAGGAEALASEREEIDRRIARLDADLARWGGQPAAGGAQQDQAFVAAKRRERDELGDRAGEAGRAVGAAADRQLLHEPAHPAAPEPAARRALAAAMKRLDARIAAVNLKNASPPAPPEPGRASYVGMSKCGGCHKAAAQFWKKTVHARRLEDAGRRRQAGRLQVRGLPRHRLRPGRRIRRWASPRASSRPVRDLPRPGVDPRRRQGAGRAERRPAAERRRRPASAATTSTTRTRSSTRPTCATSSAPATAALRARSWATARPATRCARRRWPRPSSRGKSSSRRCEPRAPRAPGSANPTGDDPDSSWSSRSDSMLPPETTTTVRRPRSALASSSSAASAGAAEASQTSPSVR